MSRWTTLHSMSSTLPPPRRSQAATRMDRTEMETGVLAGEEGYGGDGGGGFVPGAVPFGGYGNDGDADGDL